MDDTQKRRVTIFSVGVVIGTFASMALFSVWQERDTTGVQQTADVVVTRCALTKGDRLTEECVEVRERVATQHVPPDALMARDLDWHLGKKLVIDVEDGNALRTVDFEGP